MGSTRVIASNPPSTITSKLSKEEIIEKTNIFSANQDTLLELLPSLLSKRCSVQTEVLWDDNLSKLWLNNLWQYFAKTDNAMKKLSHLCIVPVLTYANNSHKCLKKLIR